MSLINLLVLVLVVVIVVGVLLWAIRRIAAVFGWPSQIVEVGTVLVVVVTVLWLVSQFYPFSHLLR